MTRRAGGAIVVSALLLAVPSASGQSAFVCDNSFYSWPARQVNTSTTGVSSTPVNDTSFNSGGLSFNYFAIGSKLFAYRNSDGTQAWNFTLTGTTVQNFVSPVPLSSGQEFIFLTTEDGRLWKIDAANPASNIWVDTRRSRSGSVPSVNSFVLDPVCATDKQIATPAVQLYAFANAVFKNSIDAVPTHIGDSLVFVISRNTGCTGETKRNEIRAYYASNLELKWVFNQNTSDDPSIPPPREVDRGSEGCAIWYGTAGDPAANTLYCGTALVTNPADPAYSVAQQSLWALNTVTGAVRWSYRAGSIHNRPMPKVGPQGLRIYVVNFDGGIQAFSPVADPANPLQGRPLWSGPLQVPLKVQAIPSPYTSGGKTHLMVVDVSGNIRVFRDDDTNGFIGPAQHPTGSISTTACSLGATLCYRGPPAVGTGLSPNKIWVARNDGRIQQLSETLSREGVISVVPFPGSNIDVSGVSLDVNSVASSTAIDRLVAVTATGFVTRVNVPICTNSAPPGGALGCNCSDGKVCGTGAAGDPFRCCDASKDSCNNALVNNACSPWRCSVAPPCCSFLFGPCASDVDCGGRIGSCDIAQGFCTAPCPTSPVDINSNCFGPSNTCQAYRRGLADKLPDLTACDDKKACTAAVPAPSSIPCGLAIGNTACTRDRAASDLVDNTGDCPVSAPMCSGSNSESGGQGGAITGGKCCPEGLACNPSTNLCEPNLGSGLAGILGYDACRAGTCTSDTYSTCSCVNVGDRACAPGLACCGSAAGCVDLSTNSANCGVCGQACPAGTSCAAGRCQ